MLKWKLYWVHIDYVEDTFVVARSIRSVKSFIYRNEGFEVFDYDIHKLMIIPDSIEKFEIEKFKNWSINNKCNLDHIHILHPWPGYGNDSEFLKSIGATIRCVEDGEEVIIDDTVYLHHTSGTYKVYDIGLKHVFGNDERFIDDENEFFNVLQKDVLEISQEIENLFKDFFVFKGDNGENYFYNDHEVYETKIKLSLGKLLEGFKKIAILDGDNEKMLSMMLKYRNFIFHEMFTMKKFNLSDKFGLKHSIRFLWNYLEISEECKLMLKEYKKALSQKVEFGKSLDCKLKIVENYGEFIEYDTTYKYIDYLNEYFNINCNK